ncbi:hypothetical protein ASF44_30315 [Pseudorhodoferax sp. Leaf274]|nr:hypothetical protein ASF44_30315 [Pseudorhodoferax sp. Leaf274]
MRSGVIYSLCVLLLAAPVASQGQTPGEVLQQSDKVRNPGVPFKVRTELTEFRSGKAHEQARMVTFSKLDPNTGQYRNLARYVEPARDAGKALLMKDSVMWFYDPASKASVRISPQQRLVGQASNGDVMSTNLSRDYSARLATEETVKDADGAARDTWKLELEASTAAAVYLRIEYWIEKKTYHPVKGRFFADSGRLLKIAFYRSFSNQLGGLRPTEVVILDEIDRSVVTRMRFSDYESFEVPERWYQRDYLPLLPAE